MVISSLLKIIQIQYKKVFNDWLFFSGILMFILIILTAGVPIWNKYGKRKIPLFFHTSFAGTLIIVSILNILIILIQ